MCACKLWIRMSESAYLALSLCVCVSVVCGVSVCLRIFFCTAAVTEDYKDQRQHKHVILVTTKI